MERLWKAVEEVREERRKGHIKMEKEVEELKKERMEERGRIFRLETEGEKKEV